MIHMPDIHIGSGNGLMTSGSEPLYEVKLAKIHDAILAVLHGITWA